MIEVVATAYWTPDQFKTNLGLAGIAPLQITHVRHNGFLDIFVRENVKVPDSFLISSSERWGMKTKGCLPKGSKDVLEIAVKKSIADDPAKVEYVKKIISEADAMGREVVVNRNFTIQWALDQIANKPEIVS